MGTSFSTSTLPDEHSIQKRQSFQSPILPQSSYILTTSQCYRGATVGYITAVSYGGNGITYSVDPSSNNRYTICVNPVSGQISLASSFSGQLQFNFRAANSYGAMVVPVTVVCSTSGGSSIPVIRSSFGCPGNQYPNPPIYQSSFDQSAYSFTTFSCAVGSAIGSVRANSARPSYRITGGNSGQFAISSHGVIRVSNTLSTGTYTLYVSSYTSTVPVTINANCNGGGTGPIITDNQPTWNQSFYTFTRNTCGGVGFSGAYIGTVKAQNAVGYSINLGSGLYTVDNSGNIYAVGAVTQTQGTSSLTVVATGRTGVQVAVPVTINNNCSG
ncbi:hypothetical protein BV898_09733 [Hypsibius exemplaris]|uniref:Uncharacterized protein n=1 Tax=Hypsibius exemplaris TaxID=2072580 RepID=A0A1W0WLQ6_HYPEX|nr:hypothetical protein BV898_09733 [Hypsibius exemplaris]